MRIAFFIDDYLPSVHGVATSTLNYKQALESLGHEVFVVAPKFEGYEDHDDHVIRLPSAKNTSLISCIAKCNFIWAYWHTAWLSGRMYRM